MPLFEVEKDGKTFEVDAPNMDAALQALGEVGGKAPLGVGGALRQGLESLPRGGQAINEALGMKGAPITEFIEKHTGMALPRLAEPQKPQTIPEYAAQGVGETVGALIPGTALFKGLSGLGGVTGQIGKAVTGTLQRAPAAAVATDVLAGAGAGAARGGAQELPEFPGRDALAELAGGIVAGGIPTAVKGAARLAGKLPGVRAAKGVVAPFTEAGGRIRAENRVRSLARDPEAAAAAIREGGTLSPAQRTGDPRLMALERAVRDADPQLDGKLSEKTSEVLKGLRASAQGMGQGGDVADTRAFVGGRRDRVIAALQARTEQAAARAEQRISELRPDMQRSQASAIVRDEIDTALSAAKAQETELWDAVPEAVKVPTKAAKAAYKKMLLSLPRAQQDLLPVKAKELLGSKSGFKGKEPLKELQGLRSTLLEGAREARAAGQFNKARISDDLADAVLEDMAKGPGDEIAAARDFSRIVNDKFKKGTVGKLLGYTREGGAKTAPELTLETTVGRGGLRGDVALQDLGRAVENSPEQAAGAIDQYLRSKFFSPQGELDVRKAETFIRNNAEILERFPGLRRQLGAAVDAQAAVAGAGRTATQRAKRLQNPIISRTAEFLGAPVDREIPKILAGKNPEAAFRELRKQAAKDLTGDSLRGLKAGVVDHLIGKANTRQFTDTGEQILSGRALTAALKDSRTMKAVSSVLDSGEITRLRRIASELSKMETARGRLPNVGKPMEDIPSAAISFIARTLAARQGAKLGAGTSGASLLTAGEASKRARRLLGSLTNDKAAELLKDAVDDPKLFAALLMPTKGRALNKKIVTQRLNAWLAGPGSRVLEDDEDDG